MIGRAPWYLVGPLIGLVLVGLLWATNRPLGALGGYIDTWTWLRGPARKLSFRALFVVGIVLGGVVYAIVVGGLHPSLAQGGFVGQLQTPMLRGAFLGAAGALMGYGARRAGGCTSGHGLCGTSLGSPASFVATMTFMGTAIVAAHAFAFTVGCGR